MYSYVCYSNNVKLNKLSRFTSNYGTSKLHVCLFFVQVVIWAEIFYVKICSYIQKCYQTANDEYI